MESGRISACALLFMKRLFLLGGLAVTFVAVSQGAVVVDTLGPGNTYAQSSGFAVSGPSSSLGNTFESASEFVAAAGGTLTQIDLGLTLVDGGSVNVYLYGDAGGSPDNLSQILLGNVTPTQVFGTTNNSIVSFVPAGNVSVNLGTTYWLVLKPGTDSTRDDWNQSLTATGVQMVAQGDGNWIQSNTILSAYRIIAVPEPSPIVLTIAGLVLLAFVLKPRRA